MCFSSGDSSVKDEPRSGWPCTAVTPRNEVRLDQLICTDRLVVVSMLKNSVLLLRLYYIKLCYCAFASVVVSIELNRRHYFQSNTLTIFFCISNLAKWALFLVAPSNNAIQISSLPFPCATSRQGTESPQAGIQIYIFK